MAINGEKVGHAKNTVTLSVWKNFGETGTDDATLFCVKEA